MTFVLSLIQMFVCLSLYVMLSILLFGVETEVFKPVVCGDVRNGRISDASVGSVLSRHEDDEDNDED